MKKSHVVEHTPIYDVDAHTKHQRHQQKIKLIKSTCEACVFTCLFGLTFSLFFWGI